VVRTASAIGYFRIGGHLRYMRDAKGSLLFRIEGLIRPRGPTQWAIPRVDLRPTPKRLRWTVRPSPMACMSTAPPQNPASPPAPPNAGRLPSARIVTSAAPPLIASSLFLAPRMVAARCSGTTDMNILCPPQACASWLDCACVPGETSRHSRRSVMALRCVLRAAFSQSLPDQGITQSRKGQTSMLSSKPRPFQSCHDHHPAPSPRWMINFQESSLIGS
jgi:hypothetical protein